MNESTNAGNDRCVVVGVDGSAESLLAVAAAARQAVAFGTPLRIVHAFPWSGYSPLTEALDPGPRARAEAVLEEATAAVLDEALGLDIRAEIVEGSVASVLHAEAEHAVLLVIGHRGLSTFAGLLSGAAGVKLAGHTDCPLLVVRGGGEPAGPVVVGLDVRGSATDALLDAAFRQARAAGRPLIVAHAWRIPGYAFVGDNAYQGAEFAEQFDGQDLLDEVARVRGRYTDVGVSTEMHYGPAAGGLLEAALGASMLVIGSHGSEGLRGLLHLGSMPRTATQHSPCPVLVVPVRAAARAAR